MSNLPAQLSRFIGREAELAAVRALMTESRLVTLIGAGGAGKTRLGLRVAAGQADDVRDGVWFVDLAPVSNPDLVAVTVADVLGVHLAPGRPVLDALVAALGGQSPLVMLDNCEHVIGACAKLADGLLRGCRDLALLATSREPLDIDGERVYRVPSMGMPADGCDAVAVRASEAVRLLADRAAAQGAALTWDEDSAAVAGRICRRLDGIPLAIELAAARLRMMSLGELESRLDERFALLTGGSRSRPARHQTLRAAVDWSWDLLPGPQRAVLARLSVFAGGFGLAAAEAVAAGPEVSTAEVLEHLGALVDKSLVQFGDSAAGTGRYRLLETVRGYAAGQLDPAAAEAARLAHRDYYLALAVEAGPQLSAAGQAGWLDRLDAALGNLRAAITFSSSQADPGPGLRLVTSLRRYWNVRGHTAEAVGLLRGLLDASSGQEATPLRARALAAAAYLLRQTGDYAIATEYCREGLAMARAVGDEYVVAELLHEQARVLLSQGHTAGARPFIESGLGLARRLGEPSMTGRLLIVRSIAAHAEADPAGAAADTIAALRLFRQAGDQLLIGQLLSNLGSFEMATGDLDAARRHLTEAVDIARALNDRSGLANQTFNLGLAEYLDGSPEAATALFAESLELARRTGMRPVIAYALVGLAMASRGGADLDWSARLHGAAEAALAELGESLDPLEARLVRLDRERLRAGMGDDAFDAACAEGRALDLEQVLTALGPAGASAGPGRAAESAEHVLTPRELDVLRLVAQGLSNPDIAERLLLSEHTVHRHLANVRRKLGLSSRAAAAAWGVRAGLV
jgi:predicted ATPase/DNA-binding CsgD family transcriptional regulator